MYANAKLPIKSKVTKGKFDNIDMRVAKIISVRSPVAKEIQELYRIITLDAGHLGTFTSVGQFALILEDDLVDRKVVITCNLGPRNIGPYTSEVLLLGAPHPDSPPEQDQATPVFVDDIACCGDRIF